MNPREVFFKALELVKQGHYTQAQPLCEKLLSINPKEVNTLRLLGQIQHRQGQLGQAEQRFRAAITIAPDYAHAFMDLGLVQLDRDELAGAEVSLQKALALDDKLLPAQRALHDVLLAQGKTDAAKIIAETLSQRDAISSVVIQAYEHFRSAQFDEMERLCQKILSQDPSNIPTLRLLADYANRDSNPLRAERLFRVILQRASESWRAWNGLARALTRQDRVDEALASLERSLEINPDSNDTQAVLADTHIRQYEYDKGIAVYEKLLALEPDKNAWRSQLGLALKTIGEQDKAVAHFDRCIDNDPSFGEAYWALSDMKTYAFSEQQLTTMHNALASENLSDKNRVYIEYGIGKALEHRKQYSAAFEHYQAANTVQKSLLEYSAVQNTQLVDAIIDTFTPDLIERLHSRAASAVTPIFVVGLPRSGSTLQEQILASHSQVEGTQELPYLTRIASMLHRGPNALSKQQYPAGFSELDQDAIVAIGNEYLTRAEFHRVGKKPYFIDKLPNNFLYIGIIALCFPNAKIINTVRHPMDSCLGCFKQLWAKGQHFTYDLEDLGHYYVDYHRLMQHWHRVLPGRILDVQYEDVVDDLDGHVSRLLNYCQLEFEDACVNFHETKRAVKTSSSEQVRKPIYRSALSYWKNFEDELQPLKTILGDLAAD